MKLYVSTFRTPAGDFSAAVNEAGALVATAFGDVATLKHRILPRPTADEPLLVRNREALNAVREQVEEYFAGERRDFTLPLAAGGSAFQQRVWRALQEIPFAETRSYAAIARAIGSGPRAVGGANAANPICLVVPCHRVIGADGSLTGFAFGEEIKRHLLQHELNHALSRRSKSVCSI
jgi:methylated-DNA-[protein]-cysteine S-methyltransferase